MSSIQIDIAAQTLRLFDSKGNLIKQYPVSTAKNGTGELTGSYCTPRGKHIVRAKIGANQPPNAVFIGRRPTGKIYDLTLSQLHPDRDWILSRILWLSGCEPGFNRLGNVDTMRRYIYIHGTPDEFEMGQPESHGCIRMHNADIIDLFDRIAAGIHVEING